jgi:hypothetical protein
MMNGMSEVAMSEIAVIREAVEGMNCDKHFHFVMRRLARMEAINPQGLTDCEKEQVSAIVWHEFHTFYGEGANAMMAEHGLLFTEEEAINDLLGDCEGFEL